MRQSREKGNVEGDDVLMASTTATEEGTATNNSPD